MPTSEKYPKMVARTPPRSPPTSPSRAFLMLASSISPSLSAGISVRASSPSTLPPSSDFAIEDDEEITPYVSDEVIVISDDEIAPNESKEVIVISSDEDDSMEGNKEMHSDDYHGGDVSQAEREIAKLLETHCAYPFINSRVMSEWENQFCRLPAEVLDRDRFEASVLTTDYEEVKVILSKDRTGDGYPFDVVKRGEFIIFLGKVVEGGTALEMYELHSLRGPGMGGMNLVIEFAHRRGWAEVLIAKSMRRGE